MKLLSISARWILTSSVLPFASEDAKFQLFVDSLLQQAPPPEVPASVAISTDVFNVTSAGTSSLLPLLTTNAPPIVYDTELLVIVHRSKVVETKLVESKVWCWKGKAWEGGGEARGKVQELAKRYGVEAVHCPQGRETPELMRLLGNEMVVRQVRIRLRPSLVRHPC